MHDVQYPKCRQNFIKTNTRLLNGEDTGRALIMFIDNLRLLPVPILRQNAVRYWIPRTFCRSLTFTNFHPSD